MNDKVQSNREEIIEIHGELKLINNEIKNIKENHLSHLDYKILQIQKNIMGCICRSRCEFNSCY